MTPELYIGVVSNYFLWAAIGGLIGYAIGTHASRSK